ncbi:MAG: hypothetical protein ACLUJC_08705, partial [Clostridia bacterium]
MAQIIESIPNISEGRRQDVIEACVDQIRTTPGCTLLTILPTRITTGRSLPT